jgi:hypothetical protein
MNPVDTAQLAEMLASKSSVLVEVEEMLLIV